MLGSFNNWNIIKWSHKATMSEAFEEIHRVVIYDLCNNMALLVQSGKYGDTDTTYYITMGYYAIESFSETYTSKKILNTWWINYYIWWTGFQSTICEIYEGQKKLHWKQKHHQKCIVFPTRTIVHPCIVVFVMKDVNAINIYVWNRNQ